jgi:hypothetical protein
MTDDKGCDSWEQFLDTVRRWRDQCLREREKALEEVRAAHLHLYRLKLERFREQHPGEALH